MYRVEFTKKAANQFQSLSAQIQSRLQPKLIALATEPRPSGVVKLENADNQYRIRVGTYRIVYQIKEEVLLVLIIKVGHRRDVYKT